MKRLTIKLHLWLGLILGLLWALQGLTGAALVFHRELDQLANPQRVGSVGPMQSLDDLIGAAETHAGAKITSLRLIYPRSDVLGADFVGEDGEPRTLFLDAATAKVIDMRLAEPSAPALGSTWRFVHTVHQHLIAGRTGEIVVGVSGVVMLTSVLAGLWIAWPRWQYWSQVAKVSRWRSTPQKFYGWHRLVGLALGIVLASIATSGFYLVFDEQIRPVLARIVAHELPFQPKARNSSGRISADAALRTAYDRFPDAAFVRITLPTKTKPVYLVKLIQPGEARDFLGRTMVTVDAETGRVLDAYDAVRTRLSNRIVEAMFAIHNGEIVGLSGRLLVMLGGLALPVFYITGGWLWLTKRRQRARSRTLPEAKSS